MNDSKVRWPRGGFEDRLEAELVTVVTQRAAAMQGHQRRPALSRPVLPRPALHRQSPGRLPVWAGLAAGTAAVGAAAALAGPALTHQAGTPAAPRAGASAGLSAGLSTAAGSAHVHTAAFTLDSYTDGTIHVTWDKRQYFQDHAGLEQALRAAGFPVLIKEGIFCQGPGGTGSLDPSGDGPGVDQVMKGVRQANGAVTLVFTPSAMPAGDELFIGYLTPSQLAVTHGNPGSVERLVPINGPLTCTTQAPPPHYG
jgi:hypothetical protein